MRALGIVTSCAGYGRYLGEWAASILAQTSLPGAIGIFTHGDPQDEIAGRAAARMLEAGGLPVRREHHPARLNIGDARNRAVALVETEWVQHLDADDMLMPHALEVVARLAPEADVVSLGYERCGDLAAGPRFLRKVYRKHQGEGTLKDQTPSSGVSPFRRSFWERSPYRCDMIGGWDTALWIGFAHLGARFVPTPEPVFYYRQHADSVFNTRRKSGWPAARTGAKLRNLRHNRRGVSILVPRTPGDPARDRAWAWLRSRLVATYPGWEIVEGIGLPGQWRKGEAIADALSRASGDTLVLLDADCVHPPGILADAVDRLAAGAPWVVPHDQLHRLTRDATDRWLEAGGLAELTDADRERPAYQGFAGGGCVVVGRAEYEATGGIPPAFVGWGAEDEALAVILDGLLGPHERLPAPLVHLWHPPQESRRERPQVRRNRGMLQKLQRVAGDAERLFTLVKSLAPSYRVGGLSPAERHRSLPGRQRAVRDTLETTVTDRYAERRLAAAQERKRVDHVAAAAEVTRNHRRIQEEQKRRNAEARATAEAARLAAGVQSKAHLQPNQHKAHLDAGEHKSGVTELRFASVAAAKAATKAGLGPGDLRGLEPGPRGFTAAQVREVAANR